MLPGSVSFSSTAGSVSEDSGHPCLVPGSSEDRLRACSSTHSCCRLCGVLLRPRENSGRRGPWEGSCPNPRAQSSIGCEGRPGGCSGLGLGCLQNLQGWSLHALALQPALLPLCPPWEKVLGLLSLFQATEESPVAQGLGAAVRKRSLCRGERTPSKRHPSHGERHVPLPHPRVMCRFAGSTDSSGPVSSVG